MLKKELTNHKKEYLSLFVGLGCFLALFLWVWPNAFFIRLTVVGSGVFYIVWGILAHHYASRQVYLEYVILALIGFLAVFFLTI